MIEFMTVSVPSFEIPPPTFVPVTLPRVTVTVLSVKVVAELMEKTRLWLLPEIAMRFALALASIVNAFALLLVSLIIVNSALVNVIVQTPEMQFGSEFGILKFMVSGWLFEFAVVTA
jgi:hypothetical protein